jgi:hypothetical protein
MLNKLAAAKARAPAHQREYDCQFIPNFACQLIIGCSKGEIRVLQCCGFLATIWAIEEGTLDSM